MYDPDTSVVLHYVEKPESYISNTVNGGVYREYAARDWFAVGCLGSCALAE